MRKTALYHSLSLMSSDIRLLLFGGVFLILSFNLSHFIFQATFMLTMQGFYKSQLHIVSPYEEQSSEWSNDVRERYYNIHAQAETVKFISRRFHPDCYHICDKVIIDRCSMLFTDDESGFLAQYAEINDKPVIVCKQLLYK